MVGGVESNFGLKLIGSNCLLPPNSQPYATGLFRPAVVSAFDGFMLSSTMKIITEKKLRGENYGNYFAIISVPNKNVILSKAKNLRA